MTHPRATAIANVDADGEFAELLLKLPEAAVAVSIAGTFTGTVSLQRSFDGSTWNTVQTWTGPVETTYLGDTSCKLRLGFATGGYGSGDADVRLQVG